MMSAEPFLADPDFTLYVGDALDVLRDLPAESVHCVVTSPPYWGLRDYGTGAWEGGDEGCEHASVSGLQGTSGASLRADRTFTGSRPQGQTCSRCGARRTDRQLGLEPTPEEYVTNMVAVFREVRRVLRRDGTCWLNIADTYNSRLNGSHGGWNGSSPEPQRTKSDGASVVISAPGLKPKDLVGIPWRLAFALQADGWYLRADIIWAKPNPMPESVTDRPTKAHEYVFLLTRSARYFYDADAIRESAEFGFRPTRGGNIYDRVGNGASSPEKTPGVITHGGDPSTGRNRRSVWEIATEPYPDAHFATFPQALVEPCVKAGCPEGGTVLDPFMGSGTTALVARRLGRRSVGIELNEEYARLAAERLSQLSLLAEGAR